MKGVSDDNADDDQSFGANYRSNPIKSIDRLVVHGSNVTVRVCSSKTSR